MPIVYFLIHGLSCGERANIVEQCLEKLHEVGAKVVGLICDGPSCYMSMLNEFGAFHLHPSNSNVYILVDIGLCHMLKLVHNSLTL